jgi:hypothetical protein
MLGSLCGSIISVLSAHVKAWERGDAGFHDVPGQYWGQYVGSTSGFKTVSQNPYFHGWSRPFRHSGRIRSLAYRVCGIFTNRQLAQTGFVGNRADTFKESTS